MTPTKIKKVFDGSLFTTFSSKHSKSPSGSIASVKNGNTTNTANILHQMVTSIQSTQIQQTRIPTGSTSTTMTMTMTETSLRSAVNVNKNGYFGLKSPESTTLTQEREHDHVIIKNTSQESPTMPSLPNADTTDITTFRLNPMNSVSGIRINDELVIVDEDTYKNELTNKNSGSGTDKLVIKIDEPPKTDNDHKETELTDMPKEEKRTKKPKKKDLFQTLTHQTTANEMIEQISVNRDGKTVIDIESLHFNYLEYREELKELSIDEWPRWIYDHYIANNSNNVINIPYQLRLKIQQHFEPEKYGISRAPTLEPYTPNTPNTPNTPMTPPPECPTPINGHSLSLNNTNHDKNIFDAAQMEIWKLMSNDSVTHFKRTSAYKQLNSFFLTIAPDTDATPKFNLVSSTKKSSE
eukprot:443806_1